MSGIKVYNVGLNGIQLSKGMTVDEFKSWIVSTLGGTSNDYYQSVIQANDGGYVAVGYQNSEGQGSNDALIVKYDSNLNVITQKGLGGISSDLYFSVIQANDGGYVAVGYQNSEGQGSDDALIVKYDSNLNVVTQKGLGGTNSELYFSVIQANDGGYVAVGYQNSEGQGSIDALIVKLPSDFNLITGSLVNHSGLTWTSPNLVETIATLTQTTPSLVETSTALNQTTSNLTETSPSLIETRSEKQ